ncbi:hypothetical protein B296_00010750 [Ensete ventricosum]|uniref:Uncharacterized protein n=1 Tax=Ensete ventricosum TaxID=4639 RepID=A0A427B8S6_ENSVE|nr:hypothetical protein B296_00010750 [Ensete ventricosum]
MAVEVEDDVFFADLGKQIALLIMDDEEEFPVHCPQLPVQSPPVQALGLGKYTTIYLTTNHMLINALTIQDDELLVPPQELPCMPQIMIPPPHSYQVAYRRESKGTGVFIPCSTAPRKKNRPRRPSPSPADGNPHRQLGKSAAVVSHVTGNSLRYCNHYSSSSVPKRQTQKYQMMISGSD